MAKKKEEKKESRVDKVVLAYNQSLDWRSEKEDKWVQLFDRYMSKSVQKQDKINHNLFIPESFSIIETLIPRLVGDYLNLDHPIIDVYGREPSDLENAAAVSDLLYYQFEKANMGMKFIPFFKQALMYGTSVGKVFFDYDKRAMRRVKWTNTSIDNEIISDFAETEEEETLNDDPGFEVIDLIDFFIEPNADSIENARWCIHRKYSTRKSLEAMAARGIYNLPEDLDKEEPEAEINANKKARSQSYDIKDYTIKRFELFEYWEDDRIIVVLERKWVIRDELNPFYHGKKPFINVVFIPVPFEFYGIGAIEPIMALQDELNERRNQRLDYVQRVLNPMWLSRRANFDDVQDLLSRPGGVVLCNDIEGIKLLPIDSMIAFNEREEQSLINQIQNTTGVTDYIKGAETKEATATEIQIKSEGANTRFVFTFKLMAEMGVKAIAQMFLELDQQFIRQPKWIRVLGEDMAMDYREIKPWEIVGKFDLIPVVDAAGQSKELRRQQLLNLYSLFGADPTVNGMALKRMILRAFDIKNAKEILTPPTPPPTPPMPEQQPLPEQGMMPPPPPMAPEVPPITGINPNMPQTPPMPGEMMAGVMPQ